VIILIALFAIDKGRSAQPTASSGATATTTATSTDIIATSSSSAYIPPSISTGSTTITGSLASVPFIYVVSTDKSVYSQNEQIKITISVVNNTASPKMFSFTNGCQGDYSIAGFELGKHITCLQTLSSFVVDAHHEANVPLIHYPSVAKLSVGTWPLYASIVGYGGATTTVTITK